MVATVGFDALLNLLFIVVAVALVARRLRIPYTVALILAGLLAVIFPRIQLPDISPSIFLAILLPPIIFEAALTMDVEDLLRNFDIVMTFAIVGTLITLFLVTLFCYLLLGFPLIESLLLGIIVAPTDPVAVVTAFSESGVDKSLQNIVEGESLFNDSIALVIFSILVSYTQSSLGAPVSILTTSTVSILGGSALGAVGGLATRYLIKMTDDPSTEVLLSFLLSFGVYRAALDLGISGVLAVIVAGLIVNYRLRRTGGVDASSRYLGVFWEVISFVATSIAFIFIGLNIDTGLLVTYALPAAILTAFIFLLRYMKIRGLFWALDTVRRRNLPGNFQMGLWWAGLRGGVSIVLMLSISSLPVTHVEELKAMTFGIVLATNIVLGSTIPYAVRRYNLQYQE